MGKDCRMMMSRIPIFVIFGITLSIGVANGEGGEELLLCDTISLRAWQGQYVAAEANGAAMANRDSVGKKGRWKVVPKGDKIALKGVYGKHLAAESNGKANANRPWAYSWEQFVPVHLGGNKYAFKTHHNTYLVAGKDESLNSNSVLVEEWETFEVFCHTPNLCATLYKNHLPSKNEGDSMEVLDAAANDNDYEAPKDNTMSSWICTCDPSSYEQSNVPDNLCAILYKNHLPDKNAGESLQVLDAADNDYEGTNAPDGWDDEVSSFIIRPGCELTGYENADKNGHMFSFAAGSYEAPKDNTMSSWICTCDPSSYEEPSVPANLCAVLYKNHLPDKNEGESLQVLDAADNDYEGTNAPDGWDDEVSSFIIRPGCELTGYENADKNGHMFSFASGS